ncbi:MAG: hypothetical protein EOM87_00975 [Clostridia bacterium]|nr:hypothetical protein [Clostridia bacterium]
MDMVTKAKINLFAVLRNLQDLCTMDPVAADMIKNENISVQFKVPNVGIGTLRFADGKCTFVRGKGPASLKLWFTSPEHFNTMIDGGKTIPIFINVFKVGFLLNTFMKLADRMAYFLKPPADKKAELLKDPEYFKINTILTAYTAFNAMAEIANSDKIGKACAYRMFDGVILMEIKGGPSLNITVKDHLLSVGVGKVKLPTATMTFNSMEFAHKLLNGEASTFGGMGSGDFGLSGAVALLEQMGKLLNLVSVYLG